MVVCNNASLGQILWEQLELGFPEHGVRFSQPTRFAAFASACGALGLEGDHRLDPVPGRAPAAQGLA